MSDAISRDLKTYSYRRAVIGSISEAFLAGKIPKISPTETETINEIKIELVDRTVVQPVNAEIPLLVMIPSSTPRIPPPIDIIIASNKNWSKILNSCPEILK